MNMKFSFLMLCFIAALITTPLWAAEQSEEELAKAAQNPIANMIIHDDLYYCA